MLQNLLAERFKRQIRREQKTISLYSLTVGKSGAKLRTPQADAVADAASEPKPRRTTTRDKDGFPQFAPNVTVSGMIGEGGKTHAAMQVHNDPLDRLVKNLSVTHERAPGTTRPETHRQERTSRVHRDRPRRTDTD